ncbi:nicotinate-nucleotide--dimethylbenzimidazole phosphoribosyltransferase [Pseudoalteromonas citrea]|uniref:Nicotinate-nucleotide--dimethylbenzimidazole phosphoribosyltransferase n=2 Tax=Pseudoalteromonas citrea TaxID=43655 RepID=A0AAD4AJE4_9GAMM|nr:nicotinate-nucleotide--dimethylbenzimidazole phosphoribosyltransferase [Pseudoalteromonas citrea]KAF7772197.1 nicotinate-nucleotide--dimethylbenzimidazole phosphoribosyltransferase [Pseudoalteromonas citrea]
MIAPLEKNFAMQIKHKIDLKTKPLGALGKLEHVAYQVVSILSQKLNDKQFAEARFEITAPQLIVFAGDHGVAAQGVSIAPSEVTGQMVANFASGGAAINVLCRQLGWQLSIVDCGILTPPADLLGIVSQRLGNGTRALHIDEAMDDTQLHTGLKMGADLTTQYHQLGTNLIAFGEMGIGNTTAASAIFSALSGFTPQETVGKGTGVGDEVILKKQQLISQALARHKAQLISPTDILRCLGGFEICQMVGAMQQAAKLQMVLLIDGFIATAAAMIVCALSPNAQQYMIFAHCSGEQGHRKMLAYLNAEALLALDLRLGEGTGAAMSLPLIQSALALYNDMASFDEAKVTQVVESE